VALLLVIAGPIGAGKSTVALATADALASAGVACAVVDLDDVAFMQRWVAGTRAFWRRGAAATAALVGAWLGEGLECVVAHGPFFEEGGYDLLAAASPGDTVVVHALLEVTVDVALARVADDPTRGVSKIPDFLRSTHARFQEVEPSLPAIDLRFDTTELPAHAVAERLAAEVLSRRT
jgi:thymidylate kinase